MLKFTLLIPALAILAAPAAAVQVLGTSAAGGNSVTVVSEEPGLLAVDLALDNSSPVSIDFAPSEREDGFAFNSFIDLLLPEGTGAVNLKLEGAQFEAVGSVAAAFSNASIVTNALGNRARISFAPGREFVSVALGNVFDDGSQDFGIVFTGEGPARLTVNAAVPEPASWALMIAGFGLMGAALRRRTPRTV